MRIDVYHHSDHDHCCCEDVLQAIAQLQADVTEIKTRDEVPQEIADALGGVQENIDNNFTTERNHAEQRRDAGPDRRAESKG